METKHTPGPWQIAQPKGAGTARFIWRNDEGPGFAGETNTNYRMVARDVHSEADARLIACAPDLLAALRLLLDGLQTYAPEFLHGLPKADYIRAARAAIAKAEGR